MSAFALRITIDTPIALNNLLHLDGLLGRLLANRGRNPTNVPLEQIEGVYCCSAALLETGAFGPVETGLTRIKRLRDESERVAKPGRRHRTMDEMSPFRPQLHDQNLFEAVKAIWFYGDGNCNVVADLIGDARAIGSMGPSGYGRVVEWELFGLERSLDQGFFLTNGLPARVVPLSLWDKCELPRHPRAVIAQQHYRPPYWAGDEAICIAPLLIDLSGTRAEISGLIGLTGSFGSLA